MNTTSGKRYFLENRIVKLFIVLLWGLIIAFIYFNRDQFTIDGLIDRSPQDTISAILVLMLMFALKSVSLFVYCGLLFAVSGILFPLYIALPVSFVGAFIIISVPYSLGRFLGADSVGYLLKKYPKLQKVREERSKNDLLFSFIMQATGVIPSDPFSAYMGAVGANFRQYAIGSMLGYVFDIVPFTLMGQSAEDPSSPAFIAALSLRILASVGAAVYTHVRRRKAAKEKQNNKS